MNKTFPFNFSAVVAYDQNNAIGQDNKLLWHLPNDLKHFKELTLNKTVLMGRKTYDSIGRALPHRRMIVLTHNKDFTSDYAETIHGLNELNNLLNPDEDMMIIGGAEIYKLCLPYISKVYATLVDAKINADTFFPELNQNEWIRTEEQHHEKDDKHPYNYTFITFKRKT